MAKQATRAAAHSMPASPADPSGPALQTLRVFVSSPGDVKEERDCARRVIQGLSKRYAGRFALEPLFWEDLPLQADMSFQQGIDLVLSGDKGVDIAIFILWSRLGSPLGPRIRKPDGSEYLSGTEREYELMKRSRENSASRPGGPRPDILFYRREDQVSFDERLRGKPTSEQMDLVKQKTLAENFVAREFFEPETGTSSGAYTIYDRPVTLTHKLFKHLQALLDEMAGGMAQGTVWDIDDEKQGAPFMALEAFQPRHAAVFFGREEEILEGRHALREQAENGCAFLLLCGDSGSGKSSLARAGLVPDIQAFEVDEHVATWRALIVTPFELAPEPVAGLVRRLAAVLPALLEETTEADLVDVFRRSPRDAINLRLKSAVAVAGGMRPGREAPVPAQGGNGAALPSLRVLLVVDQLEELFASAGVSATDRSAFFAMLEALSCSGCVWVLATVRSDFYQKVQAEPALVRMKRGRGQLDVLPPDVDALRRIIEGPARLAGLRFEKRQDLAHDRDALSLSDRILTDAASHNELLPLVEYVLWALYKKRTPERELTFKDYEELGGVEGAMAKRADEVFHRFRDEPERGAHGGKASRDADVTLGAVLQALVTVGEGTAGATTDKQPLIRQRKPLSSFSVGSAARRMVDEFVKAHLFTTGKDGESDDPSVTVAHESLLRVWPRAVAWASTNRDFLRTRARLVARMKEGNVCLEAGPLLSSARFHLARDRGGFSEHERDFISSSVRHHRLRRSAIYGASLASISVVFMSALYFSQKARVTATAGQLAAEASRDLSRKDYARAEIAAAKSLTYADTPETRDLLLQARSGGISFVSSSQQKMPLAALSSFSRNGKLAAAVVSGDKVKAAALVLMSTATQQEIWRADLSGDMPDSMAIDEGKDGRPVLAVADSGHKVGVWRRPDGAGAASRIALSDSRCAHTKRVPSMAFHPSKPWVATSSEDKMICLWDYAGPAARLIWQRKDAHDTAVHGIAFNADGSLLASGGGDYKVKIWKMPDQSAGLSGAPADQGGPAIEWKAHVDSVFTVAFSPDGHRLASAGYDRIIRIWDLDAAAAHGKPATIGTLYGHEGTILDLAFSADSKLLTSGGKDETVRVWDVSEGRLLDTLSPGNGVIRSVAWQQFEDNLNCGGENGWSVWSPHGRKVAARLWNRGATIGAVAFDPAGEVLAAAGNDGIVRIWDRDHRLLSELRSDLEGEEINGLAISADRRWLAAAGEGKLIHIWARGPDWKTWTKLATRQPALTHEGAIWGLCFDPSGQWLASSNADKNMRVWRWKVSDWSLLDKSTQSDHSIYSIACDPAGHRIVGGNSNGDVLIWDAKNLALTGSTRNVEQGEAVVWSVVLASSPPYVLSGNSDGRVRRWVPKDSARAGKADEKIATSDQDATANHTINSVSYSPKYRWVAAGGDGGTVEIYDIGLRHERSLRGHDGTIWTVAFDPKGSRLAYGGTDRFLRVWDVDEMKRNLESDSADALYRESQQMTGLSVEDGQIVYRGR